MLTVAEDAPAEVDADRLLADLRDREAELDHARLNHSPTAWPARDAAWRKAYFAAIKAGLNVQYTYRLHEPIYGKQ